MKRIPTLLCTAATFAAMAWVPTSAQAADHCVSPNGSIEQRACAMAAAGPDALRRFVERTRGIYMLYYEDYAKPSA
jgi:hypothetical protein